MSLTQEKLHEIMNDIIESQKYNDKEERDFMILTGTKGYRNYQIHLDPEYFNKMSKEQLEKDIDEFE